MTISSEKHHHYNSNNNDTKEINRNDFTQDELEVADKIISDLPYLITKDLCVYLDYNIPLHWKSKKLRSALVSPPSPLPSHRKVSTAPPPPTVAKEEASSPNTPLSFSPSESDCKPPRPPKRKPVSLFLRKEELEEAVKERMKTQQQLKESIEKVKEYYNTLVAENLELKAKKQQLLLGEKIKDTASTARVNDQVHADTSTLTVYHNQQPLLISSHDQRLGVKDSVHVGPTTSTLYQHQAPSININYNHRHRHRHQRIQSTMVNDPVWAGPPLMSPQLHNYHQQQRQQRGLIDLNIAVESEEEFVNSTWNKAQAAAARQRRIHANKEKKIRVKS